MRKHFTAPFWFLMLFETAFLFCAYFVGLFARWVDLSGFWRVFAGDFWIAITYAGTIAIAMIAMGLYDATSVRTLGATIGRLLISLVLSFIVFAIAAFVSPTLSLWRSPLAISLLVSFGGIVMVRALFMKLIGQAVLQWRVLVIGTGSQAARIEQFEREGRAVGFRCVGYLDEPGQTPNVPSSRIVPNSEPLSKIAKTYALDEIIIASRVKSSDAENEELMNCKFSGVRIRHYIDFVEQQTGQVQLDALYPDWFIFSDGFSMHPGQLALKRIVDILIGVISLILLTPLLLCTALAIRIEGRGPILYRQERIGLNDRPFQIMKFRSMNTDAEAKGQPVWAAVNDTRITGVGRIIRRTRIDEVPQIFNVLRGDMSIVGPRPERTDFVELLRREIPYYGDRHRVKPGITGWAQLNYIYGASIEGARRKLQYDLYYMKHFGIALDLIIMLQTVRVLLLPAGVR